MENVPALYATAWAVLPPLVAIVLALVTKEVYSSLFLGIVTGGVLYAGASFTGVLEHVLMNGIIASLTDSYNVGILIFLVILGILVAMLNLSGGSKAFGKWALRKVRTRVAAGAATVILGMLIFVDDYFNCLTVGSVMKPVTDNFKISRAKLAYIIDSTAAPVCIIAPISSWAAAVSGFVEGQNGISIFIRSIPYNFYALFSLVMMFALIFMKFDFGKMVEYERNAIENDDLFTVKPANDDASATTETGNENGKIIDLIFPVLVLIIACVVGMIYTGGFFEGESIINAFANSDASVGLSMGSLVALIITVIYYMFRRTVTFQQCMTCVPEGLKQMISPILILTFAWSLKAMTDSLGLAEFVKGVVANLGGSAMAFIPAILFLIACALAFSSGTSWGTFGILIPIGLAITESRPDMMIPIMAACMAGAVYGDHASPISDTTIMSSAGAGCDHLSHVTTQLPYATLVAGVSFVSFIIAGFVNTPIIPLIVGFALLIGILFFIRKRPSSYIIPENVNFNEAAANQ
ncbi:MAG TPA: Na+/H+ antiporter NhaC family protein [Mogibacterium sp.]|nr:Na+/H+ antiporter NhaC family protein [Mogibacterium sp.]